MTGRKEDRKEGKLASKGEDRKELPARAVLFVEFSTGGGLASNLKTTLRRMEKMLGYSIKDYREDWTAARQTLLINKTLGRPAMWKEGLHYLPAR